MKKIIHGILFNTDTAQLLGEWENCYDWGNFQHCYEALYRKQSGEFFLHAEGGPASKYAVSIPGGRRGTEIIRPLTSDEAKEWAEEHLDGDKYIDIFGPVPVDAGWVPTTLLMPAEVVETARKAAAAAEIELSKYVEQLILAANEAA